MKKYKSMKKGIAMIELIFALVIMGIVLLSAPMLIQQSINSSNVALQQEAISALATHMEMILTMNWDENNSKYQIGVSPILEVNGTNLNFNNSNIAGHKGNINGRSTKVGTNIIRVSNHLGKDETNNSDTNESSFNDFDDIDDFNNGSFGLILFNNENTTADIGDYIDKEVNISTVIKYHDDNATLNSSTLNINHSISTVVTNSTNIKFITSTLTSNSGVEELEKNITLKAFSCNIGTFVPKGQEYP